MERKLIEAYVAVGNARMAVLLEINDMHAAGVPPSGILLNARETLRNVHEALKPFYERAVQTAFDDIPF